MARTFTPEEAVNRYIEERKGDLSNSTIYNYKSNLGMFTEWCSYQSHIDHIGDIDQFDIADFKMFKRDDEGVADTTLYNAVMVTRTVLIPVELSGKGSLSIDGLEQLVDGLEGNLDIDVGVLGIVPVAFGNTTGHREHLEMLQDEVTYDVPAIFRKRESLMQEMWDSRATAYEVVDEAYKNGEKGARRVPDREHETLEKYDELAADIKEVFEA